MNKIDWLDALPQRPDKYAEWNGGDFCSSTELLTISAKNYVTGGAESGRNE